MLKARRYWLFSCTVSGRFLWLSKKRCTPMRHTLTWTNQSSRIVSCCSDWSNDASGNRESMFPDASGNHDSRYPDASGNIVFLIIIGTVHWLHSTHKYIHDLTLVTVAYRTRPIRYIFASSESPYTSNGVHHIHLSIFPLQKKHQFLSGV